MPTSDALDAAGATGRAETATPEHAPGNTLAGATEDATERTA
ncbi:hypothetical protein [Streptomyces sp. NPDC088725]